MGWTTPTDRTTGYTISAATDWNVVEDNLTFLYGDTGWTNITVFTGTWVSGAAGSVARFMLMGRVVYMDGIVISGTINTAAFTLPAGYRPSQTLRIATSSAAAFAQLVIATTGVVTPTVGATTSMSLCCSFSVA